jgi:hypothetical protein
MISTCPISDVGTLFFGCHNLHMMQSSRSVGFKISSFACRFLWQSVINKRVKTGSPGFNIWTISAGGWAIKLRLLAKS